MFLPCHLINNKKKMLLTQHSRIQSVITHLHFVKMIIIYFVKRVSYRYGQPYTI